MILLHCINVVQFQLQTTVLFALLLIKMCVGKREVEITVCLMLLCCSGSTGKSKGVLHTQAGYLLYAATTFKYVFDYHDNDVYWCTADLGWITGHTYVCYGPLANGATSVMVLFVQVCC